MPKTRRTGYRNVVRHRPRTVHTVAGSTCIHTLPLICLKARRGFGGARTPSSHIRQATLHNTAHTSEVSMASIGTIPITLSATINGDTTEIGTIDLAILATLAKDQPDRNVAVYNISTENMGEALCRLIKANVKVDTL